MSSINELQEKMYCDGMKVEEHFISLAEKNGYTCIRSTKSQDRYEHWDVRIIKNSVEEYVDIKGIKEVNKHNYTWIELQNVAGENGWLYGDKLTSIVFERNDRFDFVDVEMIRRLMDDKIVNKDGLLFMKPKNLSEMLYYKYRRLGRFDVVVLTPFKDLDKFITKTIYK